MKIACSTTSRMPSETANSIQAVMACDGLKRCGADIQLFIPGKGELSFDRIRDQYDTHCEAFPVRYIKSNPRLHRMDFAHSVMRAGRKMHAAVHYTWTIQTAVAAALNGKESAYEIHDLPTGGGIRWLELYSRAKTPKKMLCITKALKTRLLERFPHFRDDDFLIMPNGYSPEDYAELPALAEAKWQMGFPANRPAVTCCGHLYQGRGSELFLALASRFPDADFHWFGGTPDAVERCRSESSRAGLQNVTFHGNIPRNQLPLTQAASDVLLMPYAKQIAGSGGGNSAEICSPMKMFEYMAVSRCILSSDLPVIHEVLDENSALFCEPEDIDSWAQGLRAVMENDSFRNQLAAEAKRRSAAYTWQKRAETYLNGRTNA